MTPVLLALLVTVTTFQADRAAVRADDVEFVSHGDRLSGTLVLPATGRPRAAVVFVHGSGRQTRNTALAERFAAHGIAALVYDKRGAGRSGGTYEGAQSVSEHNLSLLADDATAAVHALAAHAALQGVPVGLAGISQAGWIVPIAATRTTAVRFVVLWSGPVCKVSEEDIYSKHTGDTDGPAVPSYDEALRARTTPYIWPDFLGRDSDPSESLRTLSVPGLWIFGAHDGSVPVDLSIRRLERLRAAGRAYDHVLVAGVGHDTIAETFSTAIDWIGRRVR